MQFKSTYASDDNAELAVGKHYDGSIALRVLSGGGEPLCKATICLSEYGKKPAPGHVFIKDYAENDGVLKALQDAGIVGAEVQRVRCGYVQAVEVPFLRVGSKSDYVLL